MHSKSGYIEMIKDEAGKVIEELFKYLQNRYQNNLKELIKGSDFVFGYVYLYYKCHKINLNHSRSYIDSPDWIKKKKATINSINRFY